MSAPASILQSAVGGDVARAVVVRRDGRPSAAVMGEAARAGSDVTIVTDLLEAFAEAALADRLEAIRGAWGLARSGATVVVIEEVVDESAASDFLVAAREFLPGNVVMRHDASANDPWTRSDGFAVRRPGPARVRDAPERAEPVAPSAGGAPLGVPPALRLVGEASAPAPRDAAEPAPQVSDAAANRAPASVGVGSEPGDPSMDDETPPTLTREELAMLLDWKAPSRAEVSP